MLQMCLMLDLHIEVKSQVKFDPDLRMKPTLPHPYLNQFSLSSFDYFQVKAWMDSIEYLVFDIILSNVFCLYCWVLDGSGAVVVHGVG